MTSMDLEIVDLTELVGGIEIPCDFMGVKLTRCRDEPARWAMHRTPCCPAGTGVRLACTFCKDERMSQNHTLICDDCGHIFERAPEAYFYIEPLERST